MWHKLWTGPFGTIYDNLLIVHVPYVPHQIWVWFCLLSALKHESPKIEVKRRALLQGPLQVPPDKEQGLGRMTECGKMCCNTASLACYPFYK